MKATQHCWHPLLLTNHHLLQMSYLLHAGADLRMLVMQAVQSQRNLQLTLRIRDYVWTLTVLFRVNKLCSGWELMYCGSNERVEEVIFWWWDWNKKMIPRGYKVIYRRHNVHKELQSKYTFLFLQSNNEINTIQAHFDVLLLLPDKCRWMKVTLLCWPPSLLKNRHPLQRNFLLHVRADLNLVLKIIQRISRATIKIQRGQKVEMCLIVLLT